MDAGGEHEDGSGPAGHFIPVAKREIIAALGDDPAMPEDERAAIAPVARRIALLFHIDFHARREALRDLYARLNPDQPGDAPLPARPADRAALLDRLDETLTAANFRRLDPEEIASRRDSEGRVSARVRVPSESFAEVRFYARGSHRRAIETRRFFGLQRRRVETEVFTDVVFIAALRSDLEAEARGDARLRPGGVYLKYFRDIPRADLQTLYPNARVMMRLEDKLLIGVPALVGGVPILLNLLPALSVLFLVAGAWLGVAGTVEGDAAKQALGAISGLGALGGFLMRQWVKYERQKLKYQKQVAENAYFKNLGNNAAFFDMIVGASEDSEVKEAILAWAHLRMSGGGLTRGDLDARIERWLTRRFDVHVDFEIADALAKLDALDLMEREGERLWARPPEAVQERLVEAWADRGRTAFTGDLTADVAPQH